MKSRSACLSRVGSERTQQQLSSSKKKTASRRAWLGINAIGMRKKDGNGDHSTELGRWDEFVLARSHARKKYKESGFWEELGEKNAAAAEVTSWLVGVNLIFSYNNFELKFQINKFIWSQSFSPPFDKYLTTEIGFCFNIELFMSLFYGLGGPILHILIWKSIYICSVVHPYLNIHLNMPWFLRMLYLVSVYILNRNGDFWCLGVTLGGYIYKIVGKWALLNWIVRVEESNIGGDWLAFALCCIFCRRFLSLSNSAFTPSGIVYRTNIYNFFFCRPISIKSNYPLYL